MARSTAKSSSSNSSSILAPEAETPLPAAWREAATTTATTGSQQPTRTAAPERTQGESSLRPFGYGVVLVVVVLVLVAWVGVGGCVFRRSKSASHRHYQLQLGPYKQKQCTDKQSIIKPHSTRHAGKAGGFSCAMILLYYKHADTHTHTHTHRHNYHGGMFSLCVWRAAQPRPLRHS